MKRHLLTFLVLTFSVALFADAQYYIRVNGTKDYAANQIGEPDFQERTQYLATGIQLVAGDIITFYDAINNAEFGDAELEPYDEGANFTKTESGYRCDKDGCYDFYLKLKWEDNTLYIGPGTNCSGENPPVDPPVTPSGNGITVKAKVPSDWTTVYLWAWSGENNLFDAWPGQQLTADADGWYAYSFDKSITSVNVIFNNGQTQTDDINGITADACFNVTADGSYTTIDCGSGSVIGGGDNPSNGNRTYWLIGRFDGKDVGDGDDFNGIHDEYKFQNGKLKTRFANTSGAGFSYACVKDDEGNWYMTKIWDDQINTASSVTLYWTGFEYKEPNKWRLPNEQDLYIIMDKCDFKNEIRLRLVDKATFDAYSLENPADALDNISESIFSIENGKVITAGMLRIYTVTGQDVTAQNGTLKGLYVISVDGVSAKVLIK